MTIVCSRCDGNHMRSECPTDPLTRSAVQSDQVLMPREPTREMWAAGGTAAVDKAGYHHDIVVEAVYRAMVDAAPAAQAPTKHDHRVYFGCECCEEHAPENGVNCREDIGVMPDGTWLCDGCYSDCDKSAYGMVASDVDDFEFPRFEDLPRPEPYGASTVPSAQSNSEAQ